MLSSSFDSRLRRLEQLMQQHQARPCLFILDPGSRSHAGAFTVQAHKESHVIAREPSETWQDFSGRLQQRFAAGLLTIISIAPITAEATIPPRAALH